MLGLGWTEMLVVGVVALIVIGPKDLPMVMSRIGKVVGQIRRMGSEFQRELNRSTGLDEVKNLRQSISDPLRKSTEEIRREFNSMGGKGPRPSGLIKPSEPGKESVADEIRAAAGMPKKPAKTPAADDAPVTDAADTAEAAPKPAPVKAARPTQRVSKAPVAAKPGADETAEAPAEMPPTLADAAKTAKPRTRAKTPGSAAKAADATAAKPTKAPAKKQAAAAAPKRARKPAAPLPDETVGVPAPVGPEPDAGDEP
jgi:sec-independent protein translocase protein TatB